MNLVVDIGNTKTKIAFFEGDELMAVHAVLNGVADQLLDVIDSQTVDLAILATVSQLETPFIDSLQMRPFELRFLNAQTPLPIKNQYLTPSTLGKDRLAAVVGAFYSYPNQHVLVVDLGTAITYDYLTNKGEFKGGNIAPGKEMRFKALHNFTQKLPLVDQLGFFSPLGTDTQTAIRGGVIQGIVYEILGYIESLTPKEGQLVVLFTGGDACFFEKQLKSSIFVDEFLTLKGLNRILNYNDKK